MLQLQTHNPVDILQRDRIAIGWRYNSQLLAGVVHFFFSFVNFRAPTPEIFMAMVPDSGGEVF